MDGRGLFQQAQTEIDTLERFFDGGEECPIFPANDPDRNPCTGPFEGGAHEHRDACREIIAATQEERQCREDNECRDQVEAWIDRRFLYICRNAWIIH